MRETESIKNKEITFYSAHYNSGHENLGVRKQNEDNLN